MKTPRTDLQANTYEFETTPLVKATGFREYDARWWFGGPQYPKAPELNFLGVQALGLGLGTLIREMGVEPKIVTGHDYRSYSLSIKQALTLGLLEAGCEVHDIGLALFVDCRGDVAVQTHVGPVLAEDPLAVGVALDLAHDPMPGALQPQVEGSDAREEGQDARHEARASSHAIFRRSHAQMCRCSSSNVAHMPA